MNIAKRNIKENAIVVAAESVFAKVGFKNAKMEDIAQEASITKVTLYSYFQSKENLYMAITYKALQSLNDSYYQTIDDYKSQKGLESVVALISTFMTFGETNYLYSEALLDYFGLIRSTALGKDEAKLTDAIKESIYYMKLQDIHNLPFKLTVKEIQRGINDGSIHPDVDPMFHTLNGWMMSIGYVKVIASSGTSTMPLFNVSLPDLKAYNLKIARTMLKENKI